MNGHENGETPANGRDDDLLASSGETEAARPWECALRFSRMSALGRCRFSAGPDKAQHMRWGCARFRLAACGGGHIMSTPTSRSFLYEAC